MNIQRLVSNMLESNVYIIEKDNKVIIIDCGCELEMVVNAVGSRKVVGIFLTHGHYDHSKYCNQYAEKFNVPIYANKKICETLKDSEAIYSEDGSIINDLKRFKFIENDCTLNIDCFKIECFSCGGHCSCCECYLIDGNLFAGDVLFERSVGRTDLKGSDKSEMYDTLCKLENVNFERVFSGHGEGTSREEQQKNIKVYKRFLTR